jgi:ubiquinone biosynthesis protein Coq4
MKKRIRKLRGIVSIVRLVRDPDRLDEVFELAESMGDDAILAQMAAAFAEDPRGERALVEMPRIGRVDLKELRTLPEGTLGRTFAEHMIANGLDPAAIPSIESHDRLSYVRAHLYETHDVWHAVTGFKTDVAGELGLQAFGLAQFPSRLAALLIAGGLLHAVISRFDDRDARMRAIVRGWLLGMRAQKFFGVHWGEMWSLPIDEVRSELGVDLRALEDELPVRPRPAEVPAAA